MAGKKVKAKGTIKAFPNSKGKKPVKPKFKEFHGGLLTDKIVITVRKEKEKNKSQNNKSNK